MLQLLQVGSPRKEKEHSIIEKAKSVRRFKEDEFMVPILRKVKRKAESM